MNDEKTVQKTNILNISFSVWKKKTKKMIGQNIGWIACNLWLYMFERVSIFSIKSYIPLIYVLMHRNFRLCISSPSQFVMKVTMTLYRDSIRTRETEKKQIHSTYAYSRTVISIEVSCVSGIKQAKPFWNK